MSYYYNPFFGDTYGSGPYGNDSYSQTQTSGTQSGGASGSGGSLVNTGTAALLITALAAIILLAAFVSGWRRNRKK